MVQVDIARASGFRVPDRLHSDTEEQLRALRARDADYDSNSSNSR